MAKIDFTFHRVENVGDVPKLFLITVLGKNLFHDAPLLFLNSFFLTQTNDTQPLSLADELCVFVTLDCAVPHTNSPRDHVDRGNVGQYATAMYE